MTLVASVHAVCMQAASVGPSGDRMRSMYDAIRAATATGAAAIRPGARAADVARLVHKGMARHGYSRRGLVTRTSHERLTRLTRDMTMR